MNINDCLMAGAAKITPTRCEICEENNCLDYTITEGMSSTTCLYFVPIYDRNGNNLNPDKNTTTTDYTCSNGHEFTVKS